MVNNYDSMIACLRAFLVANAPAGAERDLARLKRELDAGSPSDFIGLEFRPTDDVGAQMYVRVEGSNGRYDRARSIDEAGNRWYSYVVKCEVSWASWGSADVATCQRRLACMTEVTRFAAEVERAFAGVYHLLDATADQIKEQAAAVAKIAAEQAIKRGVLENAKGMKVGQSRSFVVAAAHDLTGFGEVLVERKEAGRVFKYSASVEYGRRVGEVGLVYFMRLDS